MRRRRRLLAVGALLVALGIGGFYRATAQGLSSDAQRVVEYLLADWAQQFRSTSIPLAMANLGIDPNDALRLEIGQHFRDHPELANNLRFWGANNYILTNEEKRKQGQTPGPEDVTRAIAIPRERLQGRLAFMAEAGLLGRDASHTLGFSLIADYEPWGGPLRHNFHTVRIEGERPFDVW